MNTGRDLACPELWQESLERSLARRGRPTRSSLELSHLRPERDLSHTELLRESLMYSQLRRSAAARRQSIAVPSAGGISALALLAATTLPGLLGGGRAGAHPARSHRANPEDARLADAAVSGLATDPSLAAKATTTAAAEPVTPSVAASAPAEPSHVVAARPVGHPHTTAAAASPRTTTTTSTKHIALAHDAAAPSGVKTVAHALSGGAAPAAPKLAAAAPRVPAEPQPIGHPRTGGGAMEAASHTRTAAHVTPAHTAPAHVAPAHVAPRHFKPVRVAPRHFTGAQSGGITVPTHPTTSSHPVKATHPVAASHPKPVATSHPVSTAKPAPKPPAAAAPPAAPGHYVNPLAGAHVTPERIDQGVDYSGSGTLGAIGNGKVTYVGTSGTGWPGAFIEFKLTDGADAGRYVFYAETISPVAGLHVGQTVSAGQPIAQINGGIEIGWGSGVGTQPAAQADGQWSGGSDAANHATPDGKSFSALVASLGGPPGKVEG